MVIKRSITLLDNQMLCFSCFSPSKSTVHPMTSPEFSVVNVENGPVRGLKTENIFASECYSFRGIPYMKPPLGKLRFREAENAENWIEPFDATQEGPSYCMTDFMTGLQDGQENSGTINIYTKELHPKTLLPVMIWVSFEQNVC